MSRALERKARKQKGALGNPWDDQSRLVIERCDGKGVDCGLQQLDATWNNVKPLGYTSNWGPSELRWWSVSNNLPEFNDIEVAKDNYPNISWNEIENPPGVNGGPHDGFIDNYIIPGTLVGYRDGQIKGLGQLGTVSPVMQTTAPAFMACILAEETARDMMFAPANVAIGPNNTYNDHGPGGLDSFPNFCYRDGMCVTTYFGLDPFRGVMDPTESQLGWVDYRQWQMMVRDSDDVYKQASTAAFRTQHAGGIPATNPNSTFALALRDFAHAREDCRMPPQWRNGYCGTENQHRALLKTLGFAQLLDAGWDMWRFRMRDDASIPNQDTIGGCEATNDESKWPNQGLFNSPRYDKVFWFLPLGGVSQLSSDTYENASASACMASRNSDSNWLADCTAYISGFYNSDAWNFRNCAKAGDNWIYNISQYARASAIDGLEVTQGIATQNPITFTNPLQGMSLPYCTPTPNTPNCYTCSGFAYYPLSIDGWATKDPGAQTDSSYTWIDEETMTRQVWVTDECFVSKINFTDPNVVADKWPSGCPRMVPAAFADPVCKGTVKCYEIDDTKSFDDPFNAGAADWYQSLMDLDVTPALQVYVANVDQKFDVAAYTARTTWEQFFKYIVTNNLATAYCATSNLSPFFSPIPVAFEVPGINWWTAWDRMGITPENIAFMCVGAMPVGYLLNMYNALFLLPAYFAASMFAMVVVNGTNTGIYDSMVDAYNACLNLYDDLHKVWYDAGQTYKAAYSWLKDFLGYAAVTTGGIGLTIAVMYGTNWFSHLVASQIMGYEFLAGLALTFVADTIYAAYQGDLYTIYSWIIGHGIRGAWYVFTRTFSDAFSEV